MTTKSDTILAPRWRHVGIFLGLTFGLTWLLDLAIYLLGGLVAPGIITALQLQMLLPAFSAIVLGVFFFAESPIYRRRQAGHGVWFYYYILLLTVIYALSTLVIWLFPAAATFAQMAPLVVQLLAFVGLPLYVVLRIIAGRESMARVWLAWGKWRYWLYFGLGFIAYVVLQTALNAYFGLGQAQPPLPVNVPGLTPEMLIIFAAIQSVLLAPFLAIAIAFGEEYGWRGYLQNELFKIGRVRGVLLVGVIWGVWHWPLILMGYNFPGHPLLGLLLMTLFTIGLAIVLGYAVLKSGSVLLAAYLHALNNQVLAFMFAAVNRPADTAFSFGIGVYGIITLAIVAFIILRDPIWRVKGGILPE